MLEILLFVGSIVFLLSVLDSVAKKLQLRQCPCCMELVNKEASVCKCCGHDLPPDMDSLLDKYLERWGRSSVPDADEPIVETPVSHPDKATGYLAAAGYRKED